MSAQTPAASLSSQQNTVSGPQFTSFGGTTTKAMISINELERRVQQLAKQQRAEHAQNRGSNTSSLGTVTISATQRSIFEQMATEQLQREAQNRMPSTASTFDLYPSVLEFGVRRDSHQSELPPLNDKPHVMTKDQCALADAYLSLDLLNQAE